jgi:electron transfer flavoprotein beta subunit
MRVMVAVKRVVDYSVKVRVNAAKNAVELGNVKMSMNPFCEIAVEAGVKLKESKLASEVVAVSIGAKKSEDTLRQALAMGADRGVHISTDLRTDQEVQPLAVAKALKAVAETEENKADLIVLGKQSIDDDSNATGQMLAALLGWPQVTFASEIEIAEDKSSVTVTREVDGGLQKLKVKLPAVITTDLRLNEPRYASLPNIMKARKKPIAKHTLEELAATHSFDVGARIKTLSVEDPPARAGGETVPDVDTLLAKLRDEAKLDI